MGEAEVEVRVEEEEPKFEWGRFTKKGGKKKDCKFYENFTFDNVEYSKYDCVYVFKDDEPEPFVGKLLKMWESNKMKRGKVLWFFHPEEITSYIGNKDVAENELFMATGEATGLANTIPLEAIAGKCNVVCISKDTRNPQPTYEEVRKADFVFRRTFDVVSLKVKDELEEAIAGIDVKFLVNRMNSREDSGAVKVKLEANGVSENGVQNNLTLPTGVKDEPIHSEPVNINGHCMDKPANEASARIVLPIKPEFLTPKNIVLEAVAEPGNVEKTDRIEENESKPKDVSKRKNKVGKVVKQDDSKEEVTRAKGIDESDERPSKKAKLASENVDKGKSVKLEPVPDTQETTSMDVKDVKPSNDYSNEEEGPSKRSEFGKKKAKMSEGGLLKTSPRECDDEDNNKNEEVEVAITLKDKSKWYKDLPWEDDLKDSHKTRKLVLLQNLDPSWTSAEVKEFIMECFKKNCKAKMIQQTDFSNPYTGQAFVIFKERDAAETVVKELKERCLLLSHGRPLIASRGNPYFPNKKQPFNGHLAIAKLRSNMNQDQRDAVSTSHCAQPNTLEFDMATEWFFLQGRSDFMLNKLYKEQEEEVRKLKDQLRAQKMKKPMM